MRVIFLTAVFLPWAVIAQEVVFSPEATMNCLASEGDKQNCIGSSAAQCMEKSSGGYSTHGMRACIDAELIWWDEKLNVAYRALMKQEKADDAEMIQLGVSAPERVPALRAMQRAWIPYRDATCDYEYSKWGGGSGGGPAALGCLLRLTAEQTLFLQSSMHEN